MENIKIALFKGKKVRRILHKNEWWFSVLDVICVLTDSPQPKTYWAKMKERDKEMSQPFPFWEQLKMPAEVVKQPGALERNQKKKLDDQSFLNKTKKHSFFECPYNTYKLSF